MKRIAAIIIIISLVLTAAPVFAEGETAKTLTGLFQNWYDSISTTGKSKPGQNPSAWVVTFQQAKDGIETWDKGVGQTKPYSLRGNDAELARRRGLTK